MNHVPPWLRAATLSMVVFLFLGALSTSSCFKSDQPIEPPRLVLLYAPCTVNKRYLSPYNPAIPFTPNLAKFAEHAVTFEREMAEAEASGVSYASLFTGTQVDRHGVFWHPAKLNDGVTPIGQVYAAAGYEGFYWNGHGGAAASLGFAKGIAPDNVFATHLTGDDARFRAILDRLRSEPSYRAFVITNTLITHGPYLTPTLGEFLEEFPSLNRDGISAEDLHRLSNLYFTNHFALSWNFDDTVKRLGLSAKDLAKLVNVIDLQYSAKIRELDQAFGTVVDAIAARGLLDQSLIVFTADHGEALYRDNLRFKWSHSNDLTPDVIGIPLLISTPDPRVKSRTYSAVSESIDILPTMLGLSEITVPDGVQGHDLSKALSGRAKPPQRIAYFHTQVIPPLLAKQMQAEDQQDQLRLLRRYYPRQDITSVWVGLRRDDLIVQYRNLDGIEWGFEAFDLADDPTEANNIFDPTDPDHQQLAENLQRYKEKLTESFRRRGQPDAAIEDGAEETLRSLGYIQ